MLDPDALARSIGRNVRALRRRRDLSIAALAERADLSKGTVIAVEHAHGNANVTTLFRLAEALGVGVAALIEADDAPRVRITRQADTPALWTSDAGSAALFLMGTDPPAMAELWDWRLAGGDAFAGEPHPVGTVEVLTVLDGVLTLRVADDEHRLDTGDSVVFNAAFPHRYANPAQEANRFIMSVLQRDEDPLAPPEHIAPADDV